MNCEVMQYLNMETTEPDICKMPASVLQLLKNLGPPGEDQ
jgi:hypothetical protein